MRLSTEHAVKEAAGEADTRAEAHTMIAQDGKPNRHQQSAPPERRLRLVGSPMPPVRNQGEPAPRRHQTPAGHTDLEARSGLEETPYLIMRSNGVASRSLTARGRDLLGVSAVPKIAGEAALPLAPSPIPVVLQKSLGQSEAAFASYYSDSST